MDNTLLGVHVLHSGVYPDTTCPRFIRSAPYHFKSRPVLCLMGLLWNVVLVNIVKPGMAFWNDKKFQKMSIIPVCKVYFVIYHSKRYKEHQHYKQLQEIQHIKNSHTGPLKIWSIYNYVVCILLVSPLLELSQNCHLLEQSELLPFRDRQNLD